MERDGFCEEDEDDGCNLGGFCDEKKLIVAQHHGVLITLRVISYNYVLWGNNNNSTLIVYVKQILKMHAVE